MLSDQGQLRSLRVGVEKGVQIGVTEKYRGTDN
jgi:hypothetical protein